MMQSIVANTRNTTPSNHCAVVTTISKEEPSSPPLSPTYKKGSSQHHPHHDEETTAYSSWHHDDDNGSINSSSQLSSIYLQDDSNNEHIAATTWVIEEDDRGLVLVSSTSGCSLLNLLTEDNSDNNDDDGDNGCHSINEDDYYGYSSVSFQKESKRALHEEETCNSSLFQELSERACLLLQRESCPDYTVEDYFQRSYYASARNYCCNDDTASSTSDLTDDGERRQFLIPDATRNNNSIPIDQSCRSKMMEWSFRLVEFSFPPPSVLQQQSAVDDKTKTNQNTSRRATRQHSIEALQIITTTFSYIDRLCTKYKIVDRDEYKLLSMICMNIAAKASGFFGAENEKEWHDYSSHHYFNDTRAQQQQEEEVDLVQSCCQNDSPTKATITTSPSSKTSSDLIDSNMSKDVCSSGQTIISTPAGSHESDELSSSSSASQQQQLPRPPLDLISLPGLHTLCNGLFTIDQFKQMEYVILHGLNWRLNSSQPIAWVDLSLDLTRLLLIDGNKCLTEEDFDDIREAVLVQLEYAIDILSFSRHAPSLIGIAAFLNAVEEYSDDGGYDESILDCIEEVFGLSLEKTELRQVRFMMTFQVDEADIGLITT